MSRDAHGLARDQANDARRFRAWLERPAAGGDPLLQAWLLNNRGILSSSKGEHDDARRFLEEALALKVRKLGEHHLDVGISLHNLGLVLSHAGNYRDASEPLSKAQAIFDATVGPSSGLSTYALGSTCTVEHGLGHDQAAVDTCGRVLARFKQVPVSPAWESNVRVTMAKALWNLDRRVEARQLATQAATALTSNDPAQAGPVFAQLDGRTCSNVVGGYCDFTTYLACGALPERCDYVGLLSPVGVDCKAGNPLSDPSLRTITTYVATPLL